MKSVRASHWSALAALAVVLAVVWAIAPQAVVTTVRKDHRPHTETTSVGIEIFLKKVTK